MTAYMSAQEMLDRQQAETAVIAKAQDPSSLTADDVKILPGEITSELARKGQLAHLGLGKPRRPGRR
jgi:hypothetical protein